MLVGRGGGGGGGGGGQPQINFKTGGRNCIDCQGFLLSTISIVINMTVVVNEHDEHIQSIVSLCTQ